jgi:hypothetical protein
MIVTRYACAALAALMLTAAQAAAQSFQGPDTGSVASGVVVTTGTFARASVVDFGGPAFREPRNKFRLQRMPSSTEGPVAYPAVSTTFVTDPAVGGAVRTAPPPIAVVSVEGMGDPGAYIPPDPYIAAGPDHIIVVDNGRFRILDKAGRTVSTFEGDSWFSTALKGAAVFDPKVTFDHYAGRWIMVWLDQSDSQQRSYFLISVSDDQNPEGTWYNWALPGGSNGSTPAGNWADYQGVGFDQQALYITSNNWEFGGAYDYSKIRIIPKSDLYANTAGRLRWTDLWDVRDTRGAHAFTIRPAIVYGSPNAHYFVSIPYATGGSAFTLFTLKNPLTSPTLTARSVAVSAWSEAPGAGQLGGGEFAIETQGSQITHEPVYRDSSLWLVHSVGNSGLYSSVRYLRVSTVTGTVQEDGALGADGYWYFYPAIAVDKDKNVAITYSRSGETEFIGAYMTWRLATDPPGVLRPSVQLQDGHGNYVKTFGSGRNRWGDYLGIALDPATMQEFWMYTEYALQENLWGNWVHSARLTPYPQPRIVAERSSHEFGLVEAGTTADTVTFRLYNVGATPLTVTSISSAAPAFQIVRQPALPRQLALWDTLVVEATFVPTDHGALQDSIVIASSDPLRPAFPLSLKGKGVTINPAEADTLYAAGTTGGGQLYRLNRQNGSSSVVGPVGSLDIRGLAVHPVTHELHGSVQTGSGTDIVRVSSLHGDALPLRTIPFTNIRGFVYLSPDTILAVGFTPGSPNGMVYRIGPEPGDTVTLSVNPSILLSGLTRDPATGEVWASVTPPLSNRDRIYRIDPATGALTLLGSTRLGQAVPALALAPGGTLYGIQTNGTLITIDGNTGAGTPIGTTGVPAPTAIAISHETSTGVADNITGTTPDGFRLEQNYPNPFNPTTGIRFHVPASQGRAQAGTAGSSHVRLSVYDMLGRVVAVLVDERKAPGSYTVEFNASRLASGVYLYRLSAGSFVETRKMVLTR